MQAIGGGVLDLVVFLLVVAFALALLFFVERRRGDSKRWPLPSNCACENPDIA